MIASDNFHRRPPLLEDIIRGPLACPKCHADFYIDSGALKCIRCSFKATVEDGVILTADNGRRTFFDDTYRVMEEGNRSKAVWRLCYEQQILSLSRHIRDDAVVLDIGCGPTVPYVKPPSWLLIGLDPSLESIRANQDVDVRLFGSAAEIPLKRESVDAMLCFYSIHHMVGDNTVENEKILEQVFAEFRRVISDRGSILIFDMSPWLPAWHLEKAVWDAMRRRLGPRLDMFFWQQRQIASLGCRHFSGANFSMVSFRVSPFLTFPPVFNLPWLKLPRFLYPFDPYMYMWKFGD